MAGVSRHSEPETVRRLDPADVLEHVGEAVVVTDPSGRLLDTNLAARRLLELDREGVTGRPCDEVLGLLGGRGALRCEGGCPLLRRSRDGESGHTEVVRTTDDGERQSLLVRAEPICDDDGRLEGVVHSLCDITSFKLTEEARALFLATAAHELKNPLTVIRGFAQTMQAAPDLDPVSRAQAVDAIVRRALELGSIIERLLRSSQIEAGQVAVALSAVEVGPLVRERASAVAQVSQRPVEVDVPDGLTATADPSGLATVVDHLLDNAVRYSVAATPVAIVARATQEWVEVRVSDRGVGMTDEQAARCFDKFWRAETPPAYVVGGTGIGLYIVRSLVEAMGGRVEVTSVPYEGTTFSVRLPRA